MANNIFKSAGIQGDRKEAEQGAAYTALINLGLIDSSVKFDVKTAAGTVMLMSNFPYALSVKFFCPCRVLKKI